MLVKCLFLALLTQCLAVQEQGCTDDQIKNKSLTIQLQVSQSPDFDSSGYIAAVKLALCYINSNLNVLHDYHIKLNYSDIVDPMVSRCGVCLLYYYAWILPWTVGLLVNNHTQVQFMFPVLFCNRACHVMVGIIACCRVFSGRTGIYSEVQHAQVARDMTTLATKVRMQVWGLVFGVCWVFGVSVSLSSAERGGLAVQRRKNTSGVQSSSISPRVQINSSGPQFQSYPSDPGLRSVSSVSKSLHVMAAVFGKVGEFDAAKEEWPQYVERLGHFFQANGG